MAYQTSLLFMAGLMKCMYAKAGKMILKLNVLRLVYKKLKEESIKWNI
jgi:hypothetical protein